MSNAAKKEEQKPKEEPKSLVTKLAEIMGLIDRIAKNGRNDHHNYDYATEADIAEAVRGHMAERHIIMTPDVVDMQWAEKPGSKMRIATLKVLFTVRDGDTREEMKFHIYGQGEDAGDKATYKAMTGAEKYALLKLFLIPTGHDPEKDTENRYHPKKDEAPTQQAAAQTATPGEVPHPHGSKDLTVGFAKSKGRCLCELDARDLTFYLQAATRAVNDPAKERFKKNNEAWLSWVQKFAAAKAFAAQQATPAPRQAELAVGSAPANNDDEALELLAQEFDMTKARIQLRARGILNKTAGFTQEDINTLRAALQAVPA